MREARICSSPPDFRAGLTLHGDELHQGRVGCELADYRRERGVEGGGEEREEKTRRRRISLGCSFFPSCGAKLLDVL